MSTSRRAAGGSRAEAAAAQIAALAEAAEPGSRLGTKEELRVLSEVSVGTFNETLRLLRTSGVITVRPGPGGGIFSAQQSPMVRLGNSVLALDGQETDVAEAIRIRDALDPLLIEDALWHASPADIAGFRTQLAVMEEAVRSGDPTAFVRANWKLHALIAAVSPNQLLRSLYTNLLDLVQTHTVQVTPVHWPPLDTYVQERLALHRDLVDAIDRRERGEALRLIELHRTSLSPDRDTPGAAASPTTA